jgi:TonB family protein
MDTAVDQVLAERSRHGRGPAMASLGGALALHAAIAAALVILPRLSPPPPPLDYVDVKVVPAAALGAPRHEPREKAPPAPQPPPAEPPVTQAPVNRKPPKPAEEPPKPAPAAPVLPQPAPRDTPPAKPEKPKPEKPKAAVPDKRVDPTTLPKVLPPPRELLAKRLGANDAKPPDAPPSPPANPALPNRPGSTTGSPAGTQAVGSSVATLDNPDFTYDYYIAQLLSSIDHNWTRPPVGNGVRAVVSFRIQRDGSIADLAVRESSSFDNFDLAALRAVQNAAPFPPLPRAYRHDSLGVNLIVR